MVQGFLALAGRLDENGQVFLGLVLACVFMQALTLPAGLTTIGEGAFCGCAYIRDLIIPGTVTSVGPDAFAQWNSVGNITIPGKVSSIDESAFGEIRFCDTDGKTELSVQDLPGYKYAGDKKKMVRQTPVVTVVDEGTCGDGVIWVFYSDNSLQISVSGFALTAMMSDYSESVQAPWSKYTVTSVSVGEGVANIGNYAFRSCTSLISAELPATLTSIGGHSFESCTSLTAADIPSYVISIGGFAFSGCTDLKSLTVPSSLSSLGDSAFGGLTFCAGVTEVEPTLQNLIAGASWTGSGDKKLSTLSKAVTFDANGGDPAHTVLVADKNGKIPAFPDVPKYGDRKFSGWFTEKDGGEKITDSAVFSRDTTVFAHWEEPAPASSDVEPWVIAVAAIIICVVIGAVFAIRKMQG